MPKLNKEDYFDDSLPDFTEDKPVKTKAPNIGKCSNAHQVVIDNGIPIPPVNTCRTRKDRGKPRIWMRKWDAIYILRPDQSTAYAVPEGVKAEHFQKLMFSATKNAKKYTRGQAHYVTRILKEKGVLVVRIWRTK